MCCGHGFTGMLFAACSPSLNVHVKLYDRTCPPSHDVIRKAMERVCPHLEDRVEYRICDLKDETSLSLSPSPSMVVAVHACGSLTDSVLSYATSISAASIAVMPCCYTGTNPQAPYGLKRIFGSSWSSDIARSYLLSSHGYHTDFSSIPACITPMNRIIVAESR